MNEARLTEDERERLIEAIQNGDEVQFVERILAARLADRDTAGVEARVRALVDRWEREAAERGPDDVIYTQGVVALLRAALSGPADEHPADGTGASAAYERNQTMAEEIRSVLITITVDTNKRTIQRVGHSFPEWPMLVAGVMEELADG